MIFVKNNFLEKEGSDNFVTVNLTFWAIERDLYN